MSRLDAEAGVARLGAEPIHVLVTPKRRLDCFTEPSRTPASRSLSTFRGRRKHLRVSVL